MGKRWSASALLISLEPFVGLRLDLDAGTDALLEEHLTHGPALGVKLAPPGL
ncbi:hypothetical protein DFAR_3120003 [Desulfarculales bacterium]